MFSCCSLCKFISKQAQILNVNRDLLALDAQIAHNQKAICVHKIVDCFDKFVRNVEQAHFNSYVYQI